MIFTLFFARISDYSSLFTVYIMFLYKIFLPPTIYEAMDNTSIKNNIRNTRKSRNLTQEEMAHRLGISLTAYRDLEKGETSIVNINLMKVADLLETTSEELVLGYKPAQLSGPGLEDVRTEYGNRIDILNSRISDLEKIIRSQEETIATKNEIITLLKKSLDEEK